MTTIQHKRSSTAGNVPSSLSTGELAINEADSILFYLDNGVVTKKRLLEPRRLLARGTVTNVASLTLDLTAANIGIMQGFDIYLSEVRAASSGQGFRMRLGDSGGLKSGSTDYRESELVFASDSAASAVDVDYGTSASSVPISFYGTGTTATQGGAFFVRVSTNDPAYNANTPKVTSIGNMIGSSGISDIYFMCGELQTAITLTQCSFFFASGNIANCRYALLGIL